MRLRTRKRQGAPSNRTRLALDIGTEYAKALVVSAGENATLLGIGRARQFVGDMEDGAVARIPGVVECCRKAIDQAYSVSGHTPIEAVVGIAGEHVQGSVTSMQIRRRRPGRPITPGELRQMLSQVEQEARAQALLALEARTGLESLDIQMLGSTVVEVKIDGYRVRNPLQFRGTYVELSLFTTFSPLVHIGALKTVANRLGIVVLAAVAEPYAVAMGTLARVASGGGAVIVDIGGGSTDIAVVRDGMVTASKSLPIGGRSFTRSLAKRFDVGMEEAESMKLDYSMGVLAAPLAKRVQVLYEEDLSILRDALTLGFEDVSSGEPLPGTLCLCGGGSALLGVEELLGNTSWPGHIFERQPQIRLLEPGDVQPLHDPDLHLSGMRDVTPKGLAVQAAMYPEATSLPWHSLSGSGD